MSAIGPRRPPLRPKRFGALRVILHPLRAARALALLADTGHERDLMYRAVLRACVLTHYDRL